MSLLPNAANATLDDQKITNYLLDRTHLKGAGKASFFMAHGFTPADWTRLKAALLNHARMNQVSNQTANQHGQVYEISCSLMTPDNTNPCIISVWIIQPPDPFPRFVTVYPNPPRP